MVQNSIKCKQGGLVERIKRVVNETFETLTSIWEIAETMEGSVMTQLVAQENTAGKNYHGQITHYWSGLSGSDLHAVQKRKQWLSLTHLHCQLLYSYNVLWDDLTARSSWRHSSARKVTAFYFMTFDIVNNSSLDQLTLVLNLWWSAWGYFIA